MKKRALCAWITLAAASGCVSTESQNVLTSGIYASIAAEAEDGSTDVTATLYLGSPLNLTFVDITGDDRLIATHGAVAKRMTEINILNAISHHAEFGTDQEGAEFTVSFERTIDAGAPTSIATLPATFTLGSPGASASRAQPLTITWSPYGTPDRMSWRVEGDCIEQELETLTGDPGTFTIDANRIRTRMAAGTPDVCDMTVIVMREREGLLDPGYGEGGTVFGRQIQRVTLTTQP